MRFPIAAFIGPIRSYANPKHICHTLGRLPTLFSGRIKPFSKRHNGILQVQKVFILYIRKKPLDSVLIEHYNVLGKVLYMSTI